jgi:Protein of unknown function (DUF3500)
VNPKDYRPFVPATGQARLGGATPRAHAQARLQAPGPQALFSFWEELSGAPFKGITTDGTIQPGLFACEANGAPTAAMTVAAIALLALLGPQARAAMCFPVDTRIWQQWQNTEILVERHGLRLDETGDGVRNAVMDVLRASLSEKGFEDSRAVMRLNQFLGDLVGGPQVLGEWAYTFCLFGAPSNSDPWGWQLFGHHLCLSCLVVGGQLVLSPAFMGAEPTYADHGPFAGLSLFEDEERGGLALMRSLSPEQQRLALVSRSLKGTDHPPGRWHFADHLHMGGAHQDNRVVPYEGLLANSLTPNQKRDLLDLVSAYVAPLPAGPHAARMMEVERHLGETHFCWIGEQGDASTFYYRIQSPVIFIEFDHHSGVFLTNKEPAKFHVHAIVRTPNGNDYGVDVLRRHYAEADHHRN